MEKYADYISEIEITELWTGRKHIRWNLFPDINVLSGVNGIGKSTILHRIVSGVKSVEGKDGIRIVTHPEDATLVRFDLISTPDVRSEYDLNLLNAVQRFDESIHDTIPRTQLFDIIDNMFAATSKTVDRTSPIFTILQDDEVLDLHVLSNGEKHLLSILLTVYLEEEQPTVLFMDEPEVSLHIEWQQQLINTIRRINPHVQIILTTHSPAIIMNGWMDRVTEVTDITVE